MRKLQMLFISFSLILNMGVVNAGSDVPFTPTDEVVETLPVESESTEVIVETATSAPNTIEQDVEESLSLESPTVEIDEEESTTIETQSVETVPTESIPVEIIEEDSVVVETPTIEEPVQVIEEEEDLETEPIEEVVEEIITNEEDIEVESSEKTVNFTKASKLMPPIKGPPLKTSGMMSLNNLGNSGVVLDKSAELVDDTAVKFKLEAFVTGTISTITQAVPTDIVLVLDQSGSMEDPFGRVPNQAVGDNYRNSDAWNARNSPLFILYEGSYYRLSITRESSGGWFSTYTYTYEFVVNGSPISFTIEGSNTRLQNHDNNPGVIYSSRDSDDSKLEVLKDVVEDFVTEVQANANENDVDHRISMVGFGSGDNMSGSNPDYENTEILTTLSGNPVQYNNANNTHYQNSLLDVREQENRLQTAIDEIAASGATRSDLGMDMARRVFENNPIEAGEQRQRVVIMLTDGSPNNFSGWDGTVANNAISNSKTIKDGGATVFTIGIFDGANPSGDSNENRYMNYVSTNYPNATSMNNRGDRGPGNYYLTADNPDDLAAIFKSISDTIEAPDIEAGEATVVIDQLSPQLQLPEGFTASDVTISVYDYIHQGTESDYSSGSWQKDTSPPTGINAIVQENGRIDVTGFDYQEHYVANDSTTGYPRGKKLVIEFTAQIKEDFIGGNQVLTNATNSGFYLPDEDQPVESFELPTIDVPLRFNIVREDAGQYYGTSTPANQLIVNDSKSFQIGDKTYTFDGINNKYVNITYEVFSEGDDNPVYTYSIPAGATDIDEDELDILLQLEETGTLTYKATVTPSISGNITLLSVSTQPKLYVWYPEFKLTNETIFLGETTNPDDRYEFVKWFALETGAIAPNYSIGADDFDYQLSWVSGTEPVDGQDYKPSVDSTFRIDPMIKKYPVCEGEDCWVSVVHSTHTNFVSENSEKQTFTIFVRTLKLTITKEVADDDLDPNQSFVFYITADNGYEKTVVIQGNGSVTLVGLPIGTYTVVEDTDWSYRYDADPTSEETTLSRSKQEDEITVVNTIKPDVPWLSGEHYVINRYEREEEVKD